MIPYLYFDRNGSGSFTLRLCAGSGVLRQNRHCRADQPTNQPTRIQYSQAVDACGQRVSPSLAKLGAVTQPDATSKRFEKDSKP